MEDDVHFQITMQGRHGHNLLDILKLEISHDAVCSNCALSVGAINTGEKV